MTFILAWPIRLMNPTFARASPQKSVLTCALKDGSPPLLPGRRKGKFWFVSADSSCMTQAIVLAVTDSDDRPNAYRPGKFIRFIQLRYVAMRSRASVQLMAGNR